MIKRHVYIQPRLNYLIAYYVEIEVNNFNPEQEAVDVFLKFKNSQYQFI